VQKSGLDWQNVTREKVLNISNLYSPCLRSEKIEVGKRETKAESHTYIVTIVEKYYPGQKL